MKSRTGGLAQLFTLASRKRACRNREAKLARVAYGRVHGPPMASNVDAPGDPGILMRPHIVDEALQRRRLTGPSNQAAVQADGEHLRRAPPDLRDTARRTCPSDDAIGPLPALLLDSSSCYRCICSRSPHSGRSASRFTGHRRPSGRKQCLSGATRRTRWPGSIQVGHQAD